MLTPQKTYFLLALLCTPALTVSQIDNTHHAFVIYRSYLRSVQDYIEGNEGYSKDFKEFPYRVKSLENVTGIMSNDDGSCWTGYTRIPVSYNLEDWTQWFQLNKHQLIVNQETGVLETIGKPIPITREPNDYFLSLVNEMELMVLNGSFNWDLSMHVIGVLDPLTHYRKAHYATQCTCDEDEESFHLGTLHHIAILREWYAKNSHRLYWDLKSQSLAVKPAH
ncbi:MAG: hypothetical protein Aureis2KO_05980 [Aureisphaera sp.]